MKKILDFLINLWFPHQCMSCGLEGKTLCNACEKDIPNTLRQWCPICGNLDQKDSNALSENTTGHLHHSYALLSYHNEWIARAIYRMKYDGIFSYAETLGTLLATRSQDLELEQYLVTSIPVHRTKLLDRGYNQSEVMAKAFGKQLGIRYQPLLKRSRKTIPQFQNTAQERMQNIQDAFTVLDHATLVASEKTVILIDDVVTTGATLAEATKILYTAGATDVICIAAAYSEKQN